MLNLSTVRKEAWDSEMICLGGFVHMNGRIYDPKLGRFLQADPHIDGASNTQGYNRYSYVQNNPLIYTDPSGYFSIKDFFKVAVAAVASVYTFGAVNGALWAAWGTELAGTSMIAMSAQAATAAGALAGAASGFVAGGILSGSLEGAALGAFSGAVFGGLGGYYMGSGLEGSAAHIAANGLAGGVLSELQGGKFGHGFLTAGFTSFASEKWIGGIRSNDWQGTVKRTVTAALVGGTVSEVTGGKFANGARTLGFLQLFSEAANYYKAKVGRPANPLPGENRKGQTSYEPDPNTGQQAPADRSMNVIGFNRPLSGDLATDFGAQGGPLSKALNIVPTVNATAGLHDFWFNSGNPNALPFTTKNNIGTMIPAAVISIGASIGSYSQGYQGLILSYANAKDG